MSMKVSIAAAMICAAGAMACPDKEKKADVQLVANEAKACSTAEVAACSGEAKSSCGGEKTDVVLLTTLEGPEGSCASEAKACGGAEKTDLVMLASFDGPDGACSGEAKACSGKDIKAAALASMPAMTYVAGENKTDCNVTAGKWAEKGKKVQYVVNGHSYDDMAKAKEARTEALGGYLDTLTHISFVVNGKDVHCPMQASEMAKETEAPIQYRVGPAVFTSAERAIFAAAAARGASQQVAMSYEVKGKATQCAETAGSMCEKTGAAMTYVVGESKTQCKVTATETMAQARVEAAIGAIETVASM